MTEIEKNNWVCVVTIHSLHTTLYIFAILLYTSNLYHTSGKINNLYYVTVSLEDNTENTELRNYS